MSKLCRILNFIIVWLAVFILGWLGYVLLRGLAAIIYIAVPFYDWQWYVPLIIVLIGLPIHLLWSRSRRGKLRIRRVADVWRRFVRRLNEAVNGAASLEPVNIPFSRPVSILFYGIAVGDSLLDAFYSRAWLQVLWIGVSGLLAWKIASPRYRCGSQ